MTGDQLHLRTPDGTAVTLVVPTPVPARAASAATQVELAGAAQAGGGGTSTTAPGTPELLVPGETTTTTAASTQGGGDDGLSFDARVNLVVGALIALAVIVAVLTFFYWRHTRPERLDAAAPDGEDDGDEPTRVLPAAGAGTRASAGRPSVFDAPAGAPSSARSAKPSSAEELFGLAATPAAGGDEEPAGPDATPGRDDAIPPLPTSPEAEAARRSAGAKDPTRMIRRPVAATDEPGDAGSAVAGAGGGAEDDGAEDPPPAGSASAAGADGPGAVADGGGDLAGHGPEDRPRAGRSEADEPADAPAPGADDGGVPPLASVDEPTRALGGRPPGDLLDPGPPPLVTLEDLEAGRTDARATAADRDGTNGRSGDHADVADASGSEPPERP